MNPKTHHRKLTHAVSTALVLTLCLFGFAPFGGQGVYAQSVSDAYLTLNDAAAPGSLYAGTYVVFLSDTNNISQIEISLGTASGLTDVMAQTYNYDVSSGLPSGYTYNREGNKLTLGIGNYTEVNTWFGSVRIKNASGTWSSSLNFITN